MSESEVVVAGDRGVTIDAITGVGIHEKRAGGWFTKVVGYYLRHYQARQAQARPRVVSKVSDVEREQVGEQVGRKVLGESVARNVIPFVGIATSAVTNFLVTRRLGNTVRRYMRYERAMHDAFAASIKEIPPVQR